MRVTRRAPSAVGGGWQGRVDLIDRLGVSGRKVAAIADQKEARRDVRNSPSLHAALECGWRASRVCARGCERRPREKRTSGYARPAAPSAPSLCSRPDRGICRTSSNSDTVPRVSSRPNERGTRHGAILKSRGKQRQRISTGGTLIMKSDQCPARVEKGAKEKNFRL